MKIDLHCHTRKTKKGDGPGRNVTPDIFRNKIELADIKIVAITNHNSFDITQYYELKDAVKDICQVWPGIEIDASGLNENSIFHLIVICNPEGVNEFNTITNLLFEDEDTNKSVHSLEEICSKYSACDTIFIPHFHNKRPAISEDDRDTLLKLVGDPARVFIEPRDHRTLGVLINNSFNAIIGSDVKDWSQYENSTFAELRLPVGSFAEFILLSRRDSGVVKTLLSQKPPIKLVGKPHKSVNLQLEIYPDINILFGQKGTGKSELLKSLYESMIKEGRTCKKYIASERSEDFSALLSISGMDQDLGKVNADLCEEEFRLLNTWTDSNPTSIEAYSNWLNTRGNSNNKMRMKITEAVHETFSYDTDYQGHKADLESIAKVDSLIKTISLEEYLMEDNRVQLLELLSVLQSRIVNMRKTDLINEEAIRLTNHSIDIIKNLADRKSDTVSRPSTAGLITFAESRIRLANAVTKILQSMDQPEFNEKVLIGTIEEKGNIYVNSKYRMLCTLSKTDEFGSYGIRKLKEIQGLLREISCDVFSQDIATHLERFNELCNECSITSVKPFLGLSKQIVTEDGMEYHPSNGEKGILLLQQALREESDAYFLDEPELGMGSSYIDTDIRPLLINLAKQRKYVVVATHNANIAVRTLPYLSIYRTHENGEYKTYVGNPFDDKLQNLDDPSDIRSWTEESLHTLEGGKEAFYERRDIYESKGN